MRPPGISVALKWTLPPGTLSQGESICRSAVSALREFIFGASGHFWTTNDVMTCETGDAGLGVTASGGLVLAQEAVNANPSPRAAPYEVPALTSPPPKIRILGDKP